MLRVIRADPQAVPVDTKPWPPAVMVGGRRATRPPKPRGSWLPTRRNIALLAAAAVAMPVAGIALALVPVERPAKVETANAILNAPVTTLRAPVTGRIGKVLVNEGQAVTPGTILLSIHNDATPNPAALALRSRLQAANARMMQLDAESLAHVTEFDGARITDQMRQRNAAQTQLTQLQKAVDGLDPPSRGTSLDVTAGLTGFVLSIQAVSGTETVIDTPLVRLVDCDHAVLALSGRNTLQIGQRVDITMTDRPAGHGIVRRPERGEEPQDDLVVVTDQPVNPADCRIGTTATIRPSSAADVRHS